MNNIPCKDTILYALDSPKYHTVKRGKSNIFSGCVLDLGNRIISSLSVYSEGLFIANFPVNSLREAIAQHIPHVPNARYCGFDFELYVAPEADNYTFESIYEDGSKELLFIFDLSVVHRMHDKFQTMNSLLNEIAMPDSNLVYMTQGHYDVASYKDSIIPCIYNIRQYLDQCGINFERLRTILDFGCGSGRALVGWHIEDQNKKLYGCDINQDLIAWGRKTLPAEMTIFQSSLKPPLPYPDQKFDMICLLSVFTHLSINTQKAWIKEFKRVLSRGGYLLLTLQGDIYVRIANYSRLEEFEHLGYIEIEDQNEGSNKYATFHKYEFVKELFEGFKILGYFPRGCFNNQRVLFQIAAHQDVYVLQSE